MNNGLKALLIAAGVIITCIVAGLAFQNTREGKAQANSAFAQLSTTMNEYQDLGKSMYDDRRTGPGKWGIYSGPPDGGVLSIYSIPRWLESRPYGGGPESAVSCRMAAGPGN